MMLRLISKLKLMSLKNTSNRYGWVITYLHWVMALIIIGLLVLGLYMVGLPVSLQKLKFFGWHKEFGLLILFLVIFRFAWRMFNITPLLPSDMPRWQKVAAHLLHYSFYGFMVAMPVTGWMMSSAAGAPVSFFGLFVLPDLVQANPSLETTLVIVHKYLGYALMAAIAGHVMATIYHYWAFKDNILRRISPW